MIAVDTNLLVYAHRQDSEFHSEAFDVLRDLAELKTYNPLHGVSSAP